MSNNDFSEYTPEIEVEHDMLAPKMQRFANMLVDSIIMSILMGLIVVVAVIIYRFLENDSMLLWLMELNPFEAYLFASLVNTLYYVLLESTTGGTIGKFITNTRVVTLNGQKPPLKSIVIRSLVRLIPFEGFSFIGNYSNGWHDNLSGTAVVHINNFEIAVRLKKHFAEIGSINPNT